MFWRDGTVISVYSKRGDRFAAPIMARLRSRETILRSTADPSLLVESMIDLGELEASTVEHVFDHQPRRHRSCRSNARGHWLVLLE